ncbi:MAG: hypothetical protein JWO05_3905 [Gemmatimonadetes bacterium]|nr:hypothetical protein [Gemmatimonadota bacterium]
MGMPETTTRTRIDSVDLLRGVIMILMALDHTRDFFGDAAANPTNLATTTTALFFTRWVTHFCAPVFFLLSGTGARLSAARRGTAGISKFLLTRGLWLVLLEVTVARFVWQFNLDYRVTILNVIWALGWAMVALSALVWLPKWAIGAFGALMIALHNHFDGMQLAKDSSLGWLMTVLHRPGFLSMSPEHTVFVAYPLIPWIGVMAVGYWLGGVMQMEPARRKTWLLRLGLGALAAFVVLRFANVYGDFSPWKAQASSWFTVLSFINTSKYPPSLLYLLMTLGPALLALRALDGVEVRGVWQRVVYYGRVPMFYYLLHVVIIHLLAMIASLARYGTASYMVQSPSLDKFPATQPPGWPAPVVGVWMVWLLVVVLAYPCVRWYAGVRARRNDWWLSYL